MFSHLFVCHTLICYPALSGVFSVRSQIHLAYSLFYLCFAFLDLLFWNTVYRIDPNMPHHPGNFHTVSVCNKSIDRLQFGLRWVHVSFDHSTIPFNLAKEKEKLPIFCFSVFLYTPNIENCCVFSYFQPKTKDIVNKETEMK